MPYEVCYRALLSISVVEGLKPHTSHTTLRRAPVRRGYLLPLTAARARRAISLLSSPPNLVAATGG